MNNRVKQQLKRARKAGISPMDFARMQAIAEHEAKKAEDQAIEKAFLYMLAIPLNVLVNDYWSKSGKKRAPKFVEDVLSLYEAVQDGIVSDEELAELLEDMAGIKITAEWLEGRSK